MSCILFCACYDNIVLSPVIIESQLVYVQILFYKYLMTPMAMKLFERIVNDDLMSLLLASIFEINLNMMPFNCDNYASTLVQTVFMLLLDINDKTLMAYLKGRYQDYRMRKELIELEKKQVMVEIENSESEDENEE